jgi:hypothetical protein
MMTSGTAVNGSKMMRNATNGECLMLMAFSGEQV